MGIRDLSKYYCLFALLILSCFLAEAQNTGSPEPNFRNNIIKLNPDILQTDKPIPILMLFDRFDYGYEIP